MAYRKRRIRELGNRSRFAWRLILSVGLSFFFCLTTSSVWGVDLAGARASARFVDHDGASKDRGFVRFGRDSRIAAPLPDPTIDPSFLRVFSETSGITELPLDTSLWRRVRRGYRYNDPLAVSGIRRISFLEGNRGGTIVVRARGNTLGMQPVSDPSAFLEVRLIVGAVEYCGRLGPPAARVTTNRPQRLSFRGTATSCQVTTASCPLANSSSIVLQTGILIIPLVASGELSFTCDALGATSMQAACTCAASFDPMNIPGIGDVCIDPGPSCEAGTLDCSTGSPVDTHLSADHNIGLCTGNADCAAQCDARCATLGSGYQRNLSICEDYCVGGPNDGEFCGVDSDCPGGLCGGRDGGADGHICECSCQGTGLGVAPSSPTLDCNLSLAIGIELDGNGICGDVPASVTLPPVCQAATTGVATAQLDNNQNNPGVTIGPFGTVGSAPNCPGIVSGTSATRLVGYLPTFGSAVGDLLIESSLACE